MTTKTIKDVDERTWRKLKGLSAEFDLPMGRLLDKMVDEYVESGKEFWKEIFERKSVLSEKDAKEMIAIVNELRKERGFR